MTSMRPIDPRPTRRDLLARGVGLASAVALAPGALGRGRAPGRSLVLLQLSGGNDALSTVVPYADDVYRSSRRATRHDADSLLRLDDTRALHGELMNLLARWERGQVAIVEGIGYPSMRRSHFAALDVWHAADERGRAVGEGWIGRLAAAAWADEDRTDLVVHIGGEAPYSLYSTRFPAVALTSPTSYRWFGSTPEALPEAEGGHEPDREGSGRDAVLARLRGRLVDARESSRAVRTAALAHRSRVDYPRDELGAVLHDVAALIHGGLGARVYSVAVSGFDTHAGQRGTHDGLMRTLDSGLGAFLADLDDCEAGREAVVLVFSEFGRRVAENSSGGTDHGKAGVAFAIGRGVRGGFFGAPPSLAELDSGDLAPTTDFRSLYAAVVESWFGADPTRVIEGSHVPLAVFG